MANHSPLDTPPNARHADDDAPTKPRSSNLFLTICVLLLAVGLVFVGWQNHQKWTAWHASEGAQLSQAAETARKLQEESDARANQFADWDTRFEAFDKAVKTMQNENEINKRYYSQRPLVGDDVLMYEIEYRVRFAEQQLMVGNADIALSMLKKAEGDLAALNRLDVANIRAKLNQNVEALQSVPAFDAASYIERLDRVLNTIDTLQTRSIPTEMSIDVQVDDADGVAEESAFSRLKKSLREMLLSVVRVRVGTPDKDRPWVDIALDRQELRVRLLSLRLMVLTRNPAARTESIALNGWLLPRFDETNDEVASLRQLLEDLTASSIVAPLPDLTPTLLAIRSWRAAQR
ncbi:MAG: uroporphyrinogen-III C-methyltransferase [Burkholderiales bacterium]|jgi:uncharacterized protein HemX|nr:uroporphyrinogen-III C-methyltransferase [Burkholderiales bacterium]